MVPRKNTAKDLWKPRMRIEVNYKRSLKKLIKKMNKALVGLNTSHEIIEALKKFANTPEFKRYAEKSAMKMVTSLFSDAGKTWREAARANSRGRIIYEALKNELKGPIGGTINEQIQINANLIKSMPLDIAKDITSYVEKQSFEGRRASDIAKDLQKEIPEMSDKKATLIARTEVSKTSTALTKARCENLGLNWYIWETSDDQRVRSSHEHMQGVICKFDEPILPEKILGIKTTLKPGLPGEFPNCRCYPAPIVDIDFIEFPHKVYHNGKIQTMTRKQFEEIAT